MNTTNLGHQAETAAAEYLTRNGFKILERNFRTPRCEIDIVAEKGKRIYFVEVKYRARSDFGSGLEYITSKKQKQMRYAAETWLRQHDWQNDATLAAIEVSGPDFEIGTFIESIL